MLSTYLISTHLQSKSVAISLLRYPNFCYKTHLLSSQLWSHSFAIKPHLLSSLNCFRHICYQASLAIKEICYRSSVATNNFDTIIICYQLSFSTCSRSLYLPILKIKIVLLPHVKEQTFLKIAIANNYLYFHYKDKANNTQATYRCQKCSKGCKDD